MIKIILTSDNIKDNINTTQTHINENYNNTQELILDNVIRIQTQDGSGEFIEIIFDEFKEWEKSSSGAIEPLFTPLEGIVEDIPNSLENIGIASDSLAMFGAVKNPKNVKNIIKKKSKYATKQEVIEVLRNKYNLKTSKELNKMGYKQFIENNNVYIVKDNKQIKEIWEDIAKDTTILPDVGNGIKMRKLDDGTIIRLRKTSDSGGSAIDIGNKKPNNVIHNKAKEDGDW
ncbi:hypothetical protein [Campylobacter lari]|uniref:Uncharacterized protein n=1 Tax=Campylobacter lari NCTC 11845 TaxID=1388749 RepID=A0A0A8HVT8_CAMLA|nr:hypothetical protein [Campylobacter lari]AJD01788.1 hypothetical protein UPTC3659_0945 [Campylobacter lari NCTC 11845]